MSKGQFHPSGMFVNVDWSTNPTSDQYHSYLATFGHEQVHYLQYIGTSFGHFITDLEDIWTDCLIERVNIIINHSKNVRLNIRKWMEKEKDEDIKRTLYVSHDIFTACKGIINFLLLGGPLSGIDNFNELYRKVLLYQSIHQNPIWFVDKNKFLKVFDGEIQQECLFEGHCLLECGATLWQNYCNAKIDPDLPEAMDLPESIKSMVMNEEGRNKTKTRFMNNIGSYYLNPFRLVGGYLPNDSIESITIMHIIIDLALMPPIGRYQSLALDNLDPTDILPNIRLFKAAEAVQRLNITAKDPIEDYQNVVEKICLDSRLTWIQPKWIAMNYKRLTAKCYKEINRGIFDLQLLASQLRRKHPGVFALPRAPLIDELPIPMILFNDGKRKTGVSSEVIGSLLARFLKIKCCEAWFIGKRPGFSYMPDLEEGFEMAFKEIFKINIKELEN